MKQNAETFGSHGSSVRAYTRGALRRCYLRWSDPTARGGYAYRALGHSDWQRARREAKAQADKLALGTVERPGARTLAAILDRYLADVTPTKSAAQQVEDRRRAAIWLAFLGGKSDLAKLDATTFQRYERERLAGRVVVPGIELHGSVSRRTVGADLSFLRAVANWSLSVFADDGQPLLSRNPLHGYAIPDTFNPRRPVADFDRWQAVRAHAEAVHPLFGGFLDLLDGLGWRVTSLCRLRPSDFALIPTPGMPFGAVRKREEDDKENVEMWVPLSEPLRARVDALLARRAAIGDAPLFPAPGDPASPWDRHYARKLLRRAERAAGLAPLPGGAFHPYRRAWVTSRKHHPITDIAAAGGWKSTATLTKCYLRPDVATMLAVVSEPNREKA